MDYHQHPEGNSVTHRRILYRRRPAWQSTSSNRRSVSLRIASTHPALPSANPLTARRLLRFLLRLRRVMPQPPSSGPALLVPVPSARGGTRAVDFILLPRGCSWARGAWGGGFPSLSGRGALPRGARWCSARPLCGAACVVCLSRRLLAGPVWVWGFVAC